MSAALVKAFDITGIKEIAIWKSGSSKTRLYYEPDETGGTEFRRPVECAALDKSGEYPHEVEFVTPEESIRVSQYTYKLGSFTIHF